MNPKKTPADAPTRDQFLTVKQKANQLQVSAEHVRRHARELGGFKVGGVWRFSWDVPQQPPPKEEPPPVEKATRTVPEIDYRSPASVRRELDKLLGIDRTKGNGRRKKARTKAG